MADPKKNSTPTLDPIWEEKYAEGHTVRYPYDSVVTFVFRNAPRGVERKNIRILEVGCGTGNNLWFAAREGFSVYGIDGSQSAIDFAKKTFEQEGLTGEFAVGDFTNLPFESDFFDLAIDRGALTCCGFSGAKKAISEIYRVLKKSGKFFFNPYNETHSSYASGLKGEDGLVTNITAGSMTDVGQICFYGKQQALEVLGPDFKIESIRSLEDRDVMQPATIVHSEWRIIASK